ncbi:hypothetical protein [Xanthomonas arboricola]|nr:hypothetical protein [Xanthomonas arboricola]NIK45391.1 hypothetical protein [Xanthomonas arboricola]
MTHDAVVDAMALRRGNPPMTDAVSQQPANRLSTNGAMSAEGAAR